MIFFVPQGAVLLRTFHIYRASYRAFDSPVDHIGSQTICITQLQTFEVTRRKAEEWAHNTARNIHQSSLRCTVRTSCIPFVHPVPRHNQAITYYPVTYQQTLYCDDIITGQFSKPIPPQALYPHGQTPFPGALGRRTFNRCIQMDRAAIVEQMIYG